MGTFAEVYAQIQSTIAEHAQAQDDGRVDDMVALYWPDGVVEIPGFPLIEGADAIRAAFSQPGWQPDPAKPQRHVVTNTVLTEWTDSEAKATSDVAMLKNDGVGWSVAIVARYHDHFELSGERWLLRRRSDEYVGFQPVAG
ncbi:nuclear transport factor 2 family protein [Rhodococcus sp. NPDC003318]|uniref:nuclear transport factor 2 family protein n=1 Tax=Rhodococcus sp. NPDC003318 TaxID=3364503 RepID=UPI0036AD6085